MRSRYYDRIPQYDEPDATLPYDYGYRRRRPRLSRRHGPGRRRQLAPPPQLRYRRVAFDAGEPEPPQRRGWRRHLAEFGSAVRQQFSGHLDNVGRPRDEEEGLEGEQPLMGRGRRLARRYKEPLVGVALAGAGIPLALGATGGAEPGGAQAPNEPVGEADTLERPTARGTIEEDVGSRLASLRADRVREATIDGAMMTYDISRGLATQIHDVAVANDIEPELAFGLVKTESAFDNRAVSHVGARGLTQVMPRTARWLRPGTTTEDLYDRNINLNLGFGYLRDLIDKYQGDVRLALLAYNRGPGTVDRVLDAGENPDNGYADLVLEGYTDLG